MIESTMKSQFRQETRGQSGERRRNYRQKSYAPEDDIYNMMKATDVEHVLEREDTEQKTRWPLDQRRLFRIISLNIDKMQLGT